MADTANAGGVRIVKIGAVYAGDANVPGVLMPYTADWLDLAGGTAQVTIEKNGETVVTGNAAGAGIEIYPGDSVAAGDIKTASGLTSGDILVIQYHSAPVRYADIP